MRTSKVSPFPTSWLRRLIAAFLDTYVCQANSNGTQYFYFEAFDEPWKEIYGGVEPYWGLFDSDRNLKSVTIPTC